MLTAYLDRLRISRFEEVLGLVTGEGETVFHHAVRSPDKPEALEKLLEFGFKAGMSMRRILTQENTQDPCRKRGHVRGLLGCGVGAGDVVSLSAGADLHAAGDCGERQEAD